MPGIHVKEAPGFSGWTRLREGSYKTMNPDDIAECAAALAADIEACGCVGTTPVRHATTSTHGDSPVSKASAHTYQCRSGSRWFNPQTRKMEGRAHCTCDYCF